MRYNIITYGNDILRKVSIDVDKSIDVKKLSDDMFETMYDANGVGLAAPQIGKNIRMFVADLSHWYNDYGIKKLVAINPLLTFIENDEIIIEEEGCLSIPNLSAEVPRKKHVTIKYYDLEWNLHEEKFEGMAARVIQHETDHLYGKMYIDYIERNKDIEQYLRHT